MKKANKTRKRSTSSKKRRNISRDSDEETLVNILNKRAESDRGVLISLEQMEDFKKSKQALKDAQARNNLLAQELANTQHENSLFKNKILKQENQIDTLKRQNDISKDEINRTDDISDLNKLKIALNDTESILAYRSATAKRHLSVVCQLLQKQTDYILEIDSKNHKKSLTSNIKEISQYVESALNVLDQDGSESEITREIDYENQRLRKENHNLRKKEENIENYKAALEKMREQTQNLREKMNEVKNSENLKLIIEEREAKIKSLSAEKDMLNGHIKVLQTSLSEQCSLIEQLKEVIASLNPRPGSRNGTRENLQIRSPRRDMYEDYLPDVYDHEISQERELQSEIASLDQEILELQSSLQRALNR